ncbi:MAG: dTDP-4-amino-4,6-dideoxygalactose transaminase [Bacteroidales bacterium]|nr:dTDP-4-amino-4,6-dideoxygalactose transaminase [Bacteroidales bacterium]
MKIPFNIPYCQGKEVEYIKSAMDFGHISGNGVYTQHVHEFFGQRYGYRKTFMTTSCTDAFEMAIMLLDLQPGDEVIMPSYTFVSTANPFILKGAKIVFADSLSNHPNIDLDEAEKLITKKTKVLVVMHYGGVAVDMDRAVALAKKHDLILFEDVAHAIDSYYKGQPLGSFGHFAAFSFHETKNITCGEGGLLVINDEKYISRAEIVWEKGTNRTAFSRGEVSKYEWVDVGASFVPSEIIAAVLYAQLQLIDEVQQKRIALWNRYLTNLKPLADKGFITIESLPDYATKNGHLFYFLVENLQMRNHLLKYLNDHSVHAVFHYLPLHKSPYYADKHDGRELPNTQKYADTLIRLPMFFELAPEAVDFICDKLSEYFNASPA